MALQVATTRIEPDITVVLVSGGMTFEATDTFASLIGDLLNQGARKLILDLGGVDRIDRLGGAALIRSFFAAREADAELCIAGASTPVRQLFRGTRVEKSIPFFATTALASDHLSSGRL